MTTAELAKATREFDKEFAFLKTHPLTAKDRQRHECARKRGRPVVGLGAEKIRVSVERSLLDRADSFAEQHGISRSEMIARGLRAVMAGAGEQ
jgi:hypothetical protein